MMVRHGSEPTELLNSEWVRIALLCMAIGPPIGGLVFWLIGVFSSAGPPGSLSFANAVYSLLFVVGFSYLPGAVPAGIVGLALGYLQIRYHRVPWYLALTCGLIVGAAYAGVWTGLRAEAGTAAMICVVPTLVCWAIMRRWYSRANRPSHLAAVSLRTGRAELEC